MNYKIKHFEHGQYKDYLKFIIELGEHEKENLTNLRRKWWCFENPSDGIVALAYTESQIVATCYLSGKIISLKTDNTIKAYEIGETWTHHEHRRRGLFGKLVKYCETYAFKNEAKLIYGTPNSQSTPGYFKLGYTILNPISSQLQFIVNFFWFIKRSRKVLNFIGNTSIINSFYKENLFEIKSDEYILSTKNYSRLSNKSPNGPDWRLVLSAYSYRFFKFQKNNFVFECAIRFGTLGNFPVLVVSEFFLNKYPCDAQVGSIFLKKIVRKAYTFESYAGIYFHSNIVISSNKLLLYFKNIFKHRQLPFCVKSINEEYTLKFSESLIKFQLSDCDIG
jgi:hypothetical protein